MDGGKLPRTNSTNGGFTYHDRFADLLLLDGVSNTTEVLIESSLKTDHQLHTGFVTGIDGFHSLTEISGNRLFAEHVLSIGGSRLDLFCVELRRRANPNGVNFGIGDNIHRIICESSYVELLRG